jgi:hypothetical protein
MPGNEPQGFGLLARDTTTIELPTIGWNYPPWGYGRNALRLSGLGMLGAPLGGVEDAAMAAARSSLQEIDLATGNKRDGDFTDANALAGRVVDPDARDFLLTYVNEFARQSLAVLAHAEEYPDEDVVSAQRNVALARTLAGYVMSGDVSQFQLTHGGKNEAQWSEYAMASEARKKQIEAEIARDQPSLFQRVAMSSVGTGIIATGAFTAGATGFNREAIEQAAAEAGGGDAALIAKGLHAGEQVKEGAGKIAAFGWSLIPWWAKLAGVGVIGFVAYTYLSPVLGLAKGAGKLTSLAVGKNWRKNRRSRSK